MFDEKAPEPSMGEVCPVCEKPLQEGESVTRVPGPDSFTIYAHSDCASGGVPFDEALPDKGSEFGRVLKAYGEAIRERLKIIREHQNEINRRVEELNKISQDLQKWGAEYDA